jgi:hypothetical protein
MPYTGRKVEVPIEQFNRWKIAMKHGTMREFAKHSGISYSSVQKCFAERRMQPEMIKMFEDFINN